LSAAPITKIFRLTLRQPIPGKDRDDPAAYHRDQYDHRSQAEPPSQPTGHQYVNGLQMHQQVGNAED
jgi:hypothetical protein